jgi:hypothetical protein
MGVPQAIKDEGAEAQALVVRGFRNPNPKKKGPTGEENYSHCKKGGHSKESCWFLHPPSPTDDLGRHGRTREKGGEYRV